MTMTSIRERQTALFPAAVMAITTQRSPHREWQLCPNDATPEGILSSVMAMTTMMAEETVLSPVAEMAT
jgi:hypothetical protein